MWRHVAEALVKGKYRFINVCKMNFKVMQLKPLAMDMHNILYIHIYSTIDTIQCK